MDASKQAKELEAGQEAGAGRARTRRPRRALLLFIALCATLAGLELGFRALLMLRGEPYAATQALERIRSLGDVDQRALIAPELADAEAPDGRDPTEFLLHPFLGFAPRGKTHQLAGELRRQERVGPDAAFEIVVLGGSVAGQFSQNGTERLFELLRADPRLAQRELRCVAFSTGGYKQPQQSIRLLEMLHMGYVPDVVLEIDGYNELALGNANAEGGTNPYYPSIGHWAHLVQGGIGDRRILEAVVEAELSRRRIQLAAERMTRRHLYRSAVLGRIGLGRLESLRAEQVRSLEDYERLLRGGGAAEALGGLPFASADDAPIAAIARVWEQSSRTMHDLCAARGITYVHALQPALHDEGSKPLTPREIETGRTLEPLMRGVQIGYPLLRAAGKRLVEQGVHFVDTSDLFVEETQRRYFDTCHFDPKGCRMLAERLAPAILAALPE